MGSIDLLFSSTRLPDRNEARREGWHDGYFSTPRTLTRWRRKLAYVLSKNLPAIPESLFESNRSCGSTFITGNRAMHPLFKRICKDRRLVLIGDLLDQYDIGRIEVSTENVGKLMDEMHAFTAGLRSELEKGPNASFMEYSINHMTNCEHLLLEYIDEDLIEAVIT